MGIKEKLSSLVGALILVVIVSLSLFTFMGFQSIAEAQAVNSSFSPSKKLPVMLWNLTFGVNYYNTASNIIQTRDGGYAAIGFYGDSSKPLTQALTKIAPDGSLLWQQNYRFLYSSVGLVQTDDGGYATAGNAGNGFFTLLKTDSQGSVEWVKNFTVTASQKVGGNALGFCQAKDGGFVIVGGCTDWQRNVPSEVPEPSLGGFMLRTDSCGRQQWVKIYAQSIGAFFDSVIQTSDGNYVLVGSTTSDPNPWLENNTAVLVKTDSSGGLVFTKTFGAEPATKPNYRIGNEASNFTLSSQIAKAVVETPDGGYALAGYTFYSNGFSIGAEHAWLIKTNSKGNIEFSKTYGTTNQDFVYSLITTSDGGFALAGKTPIFSDQPPLVFSSMWLIKADANGNLQWTQSFGSRTYGNADVSIAYSLIETNDGGFALAGSNNAGSTMKGGLYYIVKTTPVLPTPNPTPTSTVPEITTLIAVLPLFLLILLAVIFRLNRHGVL